MGGEGKMAAGPMSAVVLRGDALDVLRTLPDGAARKELADHRCSLPSSISEALNSGDGTYRP